MEFSKFLHILDLIKIKLRIKIYSLATKLKYTFYPNISFGQKTSFYGFPKFRNYPGGSISIGENCTFLSKATSNLIGINRPCIISTLTKNANIEIGNDCGFSGTVIGAFINVQIGNNVKCGANTLITDSDWHNDDYRSGPIRPIIIENNVWLGEGVKVLKGVTIGKNTVIGAGSVVTKNIPADVIAGGNPCKVIKSLP
jgi:acetyltransferase-like isoleucine patch superfamily enzyme